MSDLFHEKVPFEFIEEVFKIIMLCSRHTFQLLTKRIDVAFEFMKNIVSNEAFPNLHLGVTVCTPNEKPKIDILRQIPAAVRFISFEPLLADMGELNLDGIHWVIVGCESGPKRRECKTEWVQSIDDQCKAADVPLFVKQIHRDGKLVKMPAEFPQEYPKE